MICLELNIFEFALQLSVILMGCLGGQDEASVIHENQDMLLQKSVIDIGSKLKCREREREL